MWPPLWFLFPLLRIPGDGPAFKAVVCETVTLKSLLAHQTHYEKGNYICYETHGI